jgi:lysophospholipase L1-like esterase
VNQNNYTNQWATFGSVCTNDGSVSVVLADDGGDKYPVQVGADAIQAVRTSTTCASTAPPVPTGVTATPSGPDRIHVTWTDPSGGTAQFVISNGNVSQPNLGAGTTSYDWTGLTPGTYMCFTVKSVNPLTGASSDWSAYGCTTIPVVADVPSGLTATVVSGSTIHVSWNAVADPAAGYVLSNGNVSSANLPAGTTSYDWTGLTPGTYMCFTVKSVNISGGSDWSPYACATIPQIPGTPGGVTATAVPGSTSAVEISWNAVSGTVDQYAVTDGTTTMVTDGHTTSLAWTGLAPGATLCVTVSAENVSGSSAPSAASCVTVPQPTYAIVGDSYSSGQGAGNYDPGTDTTSDQCHRTANSFGRQYAAGPPVVYAPADVAQPACSGATIANLTTTGQFGEPAQISQIPPTANLVTVTIGGNDAGFAGVLARCVLLLSCEDYYTQDDANNLDVAIDSLATPLTNAYEAVRAQAPHARIVVLTYPGILTPPGPVSGCAGELGMSSSDISWLIEETEHLDDVISDAAAAAGVEVLDERDAFVGHEICSSTPWVNGLQILSDFSDSFHPNTLGYAQEAADLAAYLAQNPVAPAAAAALAPAAATPGWTWKKPLNIPTQLQSEAELAQLSNPLNVVTYMKQPGYNRADWTTHYSRFSHTRCEVNYNVQQRDGTAVTLGPDDCAPAFGAWQDPYYGSSLGWLEWWEVQVDHVVPQRNAYDMGAYLWTNTAGTFDTDRWRDFANDEYGLELLTISKDSNNEKSDLPIDRWLPWGNVDFVCNYVKIWIDVKYHYNLNVTQRELDELTKQLTACADGAPVPPTPLPGTPTALTLYETPVNDTLLTTARQAAPANPATPAPVATSVGSATGWVEMLSQGGTGTMTTAEPAVSGNGFIWNDPTLEGQEILPGPWDMGQELSTTSGTVTADVHIRAYLRAADGTLGLFAEATQTGVTITPAGATVSLPAVTAPPVCVTAGQRLYYDVVLNITGNTMGTAGAVQLKEGTGTNVVTTPGYLPGCTNTPTP